MHPLAVLQLLTLLTLANGAPIAAKDLLGDRYAWPVDGGLHFLDGRPLLGKSKSWRGLLVALGACSVAAPMLGLDWRLGVVIGLAAMIGDLASSFTKRRLDLKPSSRATGLDQIPESLLPALVAAGALDVGALD